MREDFNKHSPLTNHPFKLVNHYRKPFPDNSLHEFYYSGLDCSDLHYSEIQFGDIKYSKTLLREINDE